MANFSSFEEELREARKKILNAKNKSELEKAVDGLSLKLSISMHNSYAMGEIKAITLSTIKEIGKFWMHDATREDICRWVQTLICVLNEEE